MTWDVLLVSAVILGLVTWLFHDQDRRLRAVEEALGVRQATGRIDAAREAARAKMADPHARAAAELHDTLPSEAPTWFRPGLATDVVGRVVPVLTDPADRDDARGRTWVGLGRPGPLEREPGEKEAGR